MKKVIFLAALFATVLILNIQAYAQPLSDISNDPGDYEYFDSSEISNGRTGQYINFTKLENGNSIELPRLDYKNPDRDEWIRINKTLQGTDCGFRIDLKRSEYTKNTDAVYDNYLIKGRIWIESAYSLYTNAARLEFENAAVNTFSINSLLQAEADTSIDIAPNTWVDYETAVSIPKRKADIYIDGNLAYTVNIPENTGKLESVSFICSGGTGDIYFDRLTVTGLVKEYVNGTEYPTSIYPDDSAVIEYLDDKAAFHCFSKLMYANGVKKRISGEPWYNADEDELYIPYQDINDAFYTDLRMSDGNLMIGEDIYSASVTRGDTAYVGIKAFAKNVLDKKVFSFKTGIIIISDEEPDFDTDGWQYTFLRNDSAITQLNDIDFINGFMQYERPDSSEIMRSFTDKAAAHPRLLLNAEGFSRLREYYNTDSVYRAYARLFISEADNIVNNTTPVSYVYDDNMRMLQTADKVKDRFIVLGYAYQMTGERKYCERAYREIEALSGFPDYNTSHIIDTATFTFAAALAYDWMYDGFTQEERNAAKELCLNKCLKVLAGGMYGRITGTSDSITGGWSAFKDTSNFNTIVSGATICAAIAVMENNPEYCSEIISQALRSAEYGLMNFSPSGGWSEGPGYWDYTWEFLGYYITSLKSAFGTAFSLDTAKGLEHSLDFAKACIGVSGINNFHDSAPSNSNSFDSFLCLSYIFDDDEARSMRIDELKNATVSPEVFDMLFYKAPLDTNGSRCTYVEGTELFSVRNKVQDSDFYFSTHFGTTSGYHQHSDCSSFVLDLLGERWAEDLGSEDYNLQNQLGYSDEDLYRKREEGHNVLVIAPDYHFSQKQNEFVKIDRYASNEESAFVTADMSGIYKNTSEMNIGYYIGDDYNSVTFRSEFTLTEQSDVYWFMHTKADIKIDGNTAYLAQNGKTVKVVFETNAQNAQITACAAEPLKTSPQVPEQNKNSGYKKLAISFNSDGKTVLTVKISAADCNSAINTTDISEWTLEESSEVTLFEPKSADEYVNVVRAAVSDSYSNVTEKPTVKLAVTDEDNGIYCGYSELRLTELNKRYLVMKADIFPVCDLVSFVTGNNSVISGEMQLLSGLWNNCIVVYDKENGQAKTIINGADFGWHDAEIKKDCIRLAVYNSSKGGYAYISGYRIDESDIIPELPKEPILATDLQNEDGVIFAKNGDSIEDIFCLNGCVEVYADTSLTSKTFGNMLSDGNIVMLRSLGAYKYYTVHKEETAEIDSEAEALVQCFDSFSELTFSRADVTAANGIGGKRMDDISARIKGRADEHDYFFQYSSNMLSDSDFTLEMLIYPDVSANEFVFTTAQNRRISCGFTADELIMGKWNRITIVHDAAANTNILYINSVPHSIYEGSISGGVVRFVIYSSSGADKEMYIDDFCVYSGKIILRDIEGDFFNDSVFINGYGNVTAEEFLGAVQLNNDSLNAVVCDSNGNEYSGKIYDSCELHIRKGSNTLRRYIFRSPYGIFTEPVLNNGTVTFIADAKEKTNAIVFAAHYDTEGNLTRLKAEEYDLIGKKSIDINSGEDTVRLFFWDRNMQEPFIHTKVIN